MYSQYSRPSYDLRLYLEGDQLSGYDYLLENYCYVAFSRYTKFSTIGVRNQFTNVLAIS